MYIINIPGKGKDKSINLPIKNYVVPKVPATWGKNVLGLPFRVLKSLKYHFAQCYK